MLPEECINAFETPSVRAGFVSLRPLTPGDVVALEAAGISLTEDLTVGNALLTANLLMSGSFKLPLRFRFLCTRKQRLRAVSRVLETAFNALVPGRNVAKVESLLPSGYGWPLEMAEKLTRASVTMKVKQQNSAMKLSESRAYEDANLELDEQKELSGAADSDAEQMVRDKYEKKRIEIAKERAHEDARNTRENANAEVRQKNDEAQKWESMKRNVEITIRQLADEIAVAEKKGTQAQVDALKETLKSAEAKSEEYGRRGDRARFEARIAGITSNEQDIVERTANANANAELRRLDNEKNRREAELKERKAQEEAERMQKLKSDEMRLEDEIFKNENEIGSIVARTGPQGALKAHDRISSLGGFSSASAASLTGIGVVPQQNKEVSRLTNIVQSLKAELEDIRDCIKDSNSRFS